MQSAAIYLEPSKNPMCGECKVSIDLDQQFKHIFGVLVCNKCKNEVPEKYSLLTKTECKEASENYRQLSHELHLPRLCH
jgi:DNA-repair protein complementing XP-A cells